MAFLHENITFYKIMQPHTTFTRRVVGWGGGATNLKGGFVTLLSWNVLN